MNVFLEQIVFAARDDDFKGWMQILVVVIMAVVYGLSGIIKAAKSKKQEGKEEQQGGGPFDSLDDARDRQAPVSPSARRGGQDKPSDSLDGARDRQPGPATHRESEQPFLIVSKELQFKPQLEISKPETQAKIQELAELEPSIEELPEFISEKVEELEHKQTRTAFPAEEISKVSYLDEPLFDVSDPESLRRAILHYEILGKPISLRGPDEQII